MEKIKSGLVNRNVTVGGHRTSMRLARDHWNAVQDVCLRENITLSELIESAIAAHPEQNHSNALRCYLLNYYRHKLRRRVVVGVGGGVVQGASADGPCDVIVLDYDTSGYGREDGLVEVPQENGLTTDAFVHEHGADHSPSARKWVKEIHETDWAKLEEIAA